MAEIVDDASIPEGVDSDESIDGAVLASDDSVEHKAPDLSADSPALAIFSRVHPTGYVAAGALIAALIGHFAFDTERLVGNMAWWHWVGLALFVALSVMPDQLNMLRRGIESIADLMLRLVWVLGWAVFIVQLINVITRYLNPLFETDILIGQLTSASWQIFALLALLGLPYGVKAAVNPRIDFWWAEWSDRKKAWLDFVMHTFFFLPFLFSITLILRRFAATALGQRRGDGSWPSGWRVWETWEDSPDADQLPVGPIKVFIFIGFVLFAFQIGAEIIKTGFVLMGRRDYGQIASGDEFQRIE